MIQSIIRDEMSTVLRELLTAQKNEINAMIVQYLRQQRAVTPKPQSTVVSSANPQTMVASSPNPQTMVVASPKPQTTIISSLNPTPILDGRQQNALKLARSGQLNQAFEYVLSASDLNLVLYLCENLRPADLFSIQPCPLQIPVILSLIQQLAADLTTHQELKYQ